MKVAVEKYWQFNGIKTPSVKARTKVLASFEAGMNSPNLPWHVKITLLNHRRRFEEVPCLRQIIHRPKSRVVRFFSVDNCSLEILRLFFFINKSHFRALISSFKKKRNVTESCYGQNYFVVFFFTRVRTGG